MKIEATPELLLDDMKGMCMLYAGHDWTPATESICTRIPYVCVGAFAA